MLYGQVDASYTIHKLIVIFRKQYLFFFQIFIQNTDAYYMKYHIWKNEIC